MCGIAGYMGENSYDFVFNALKRMEYRGYDSWGIASKIWDGSIINRKQLGAPSESKEELIWIQEAKACIGHTRWATHGKVCVENAHPIKSGEHFIVHNGIIENYVELKNKLSDRYVFKTDTDTEVIAHAFSSIVDKQVFSEPIREMRSTICALKQILHGEYSFLILSQKFDAILGICNGPPLLIDLDNRIASDSIAFAGYSQNVSAFEKGDCFFVYKNKLFMYKSVRENKVFNQLKSYSVPDLDLGPLSHPHYMIKEIYEQENLPKRLTKIDNLAINKSVVMVGCGSSYNAALACRNVFEDVLQCNTTVEYASEFFHRDLDCYRDNTTFIFISQSGETRDVIQAMQYVFQKREKDKICLITNNVNSAGAKLAGNVIDLNCGREIGVAATKTFTKTILALYKIIALSSRDKIKLQYFYDADLTCTNKHIKAVFALEPQIKSIAQTIARCYNHVIFMGSGQLYAIARECALKLKEVAYIHSEAMPSAEIKHGPIAVIDDETLCVFLTRKKCYDRTESNIREIESRGGNYIVVGNNIVEDSHNIVFPECSEMSALICVSIIGQLLAYHAAVELKRNIDKPRNLAKSVTV